MYKYIIIFFLALTLTSTSQLRYSATGTTVTYDTTGQFALTTLTGSLGYLKEVGEVVMKNGIALADSFSVWASFSDSIEVAFFVRPESRYKSFAQSDTTGRVTPSSAHLWHIQNGAGHVVIPWYRIRGTITDLYKHADRYKVYIWIRKVADLHTYGTASTGKSAGVMEIKFQLHQ